MSGLWSAGTTAGSGLLLLLLFLFEKVFEVGLCPVPVVVSDQRLEFGFHGAGDALVARNPAFVFLGAFLNGQLGPLVQVPILLLQVLDENPGEHEEFFLSLSFFHG